MNYRHAFHAGNFADVMKHVVLARILTYLIQKPAPLRYIDTHAGIGWYDLASDEARRTDEWRTGIGRLDPALAPAEVRALLDPYVNAVGSRDAEARPIAYPGSPAIAHDILRPSDRLLLCEKHPADAAALRAAFKGDKRVKILEQDGYRTLNAAVPPPERRGLVLIDPPFEDRAEFDAMAEAFAAAYRKWPTGTYILWYPIKEPVQVSRFHRAVEAAALPHRMTITMQRDARLDEPERLRGSGLLIVNPPYTLPSEVELLMPFVAASLGHADEAPWRWHVDARLT